MPYSADPSRYDDMAYRRVGRSGLKLPAVSLGIWQNFGSVTPYETSRAILLRAFDLGVTHIDAANNYGPVPGSAEETLGRVLKTDLAPYRDELIISTKAGYGMWPGPYGDWGSRKYMLASLDQSRRGYGKHRLLAPGPGPADRPVSRRNPRRFPGGAGRFFEGSGHHARAPGRYP